jgi:hypothetical protein
LVVATSISIVVTPVAEERSNVAVSSTSKSSPL